MIERWKNVQASPTQRFVGWILADAHNGKTGVCNPSVQRICQLTGFSDRAVANALRELEKSGHITVLRAVGGRSKYALHPRTTFTPEGGSPPKEVRVTPEGGSGPPPNVDTKTPERRSGNPIEPEGEPELSGREPGILENFPSNGSMAVESPLSDEERQKFNLSEEPAMAQIHDWDADLSANERPQLVEACLSRYPLRKGSQDFASRKLTAQPIEELRKIKSAIDAMAAYFAELPKEQHRFLPRMENYISEKKYLMPVNEIFWSAPQPNQQPRELTDGQKHRLEAENERIDRLNRDQEKEDALYREKIRVRGEWMRADPETRNPIPPYATEEEILQYGGVIKS